ncbi:MAG: PTS sugar transporter subunit IIA [Planctomycetota bacterium]|jgi:fructose-specific phosphotransferase system IIA component
MILTEVLQPACIKVPLQAKDKKSAINELVDLLDTNGQLLEKNIALDAVFTREQTRSTGIGSGIAIPHGKCKAVKELVMAVGVARQPIDFESIDGKPVTIIILLVSPVDQTGPHIQALARISRLMLDTHFRQSVENADSGEQVYELFSKKETSE